MTKIALLCPTRGRPEQCRRMVESVRRTASSPVSIWIGKHTWDQPSEYADMLKEIGFENIHPCYFNQDDGLPTVFKWNAMAKMAMQEDSETVLFMLAADDIVFETPGWDKALIEHYEGLENKIHVYALQDSRDTAGTPHPIVTREWIDAMGYAFPPIFLHWYVDTWIVGIASSVGAFTHLKDFRLTHDKPSDRGQPDETHSRIRRMGWHERDRYVNETCGHFLNVEKARLRCALGGAYLFSWRICIMKIWIASILHKIGGCVCKFSAHMAGCNRPCLVKAKDDTHIMCGYMSDDGKRFIGYWGIDLTQEVRDSIRNIIL